MRHVQLKDKVLVFCSVADDPNFVSISWWVALLATMCGGLAIIAVAAFWLAFHEGAQQDDDLVQLGTQVNTTNVQWGQRYTMVDGAIPNLPNYIENL